MNSKSILSLLVLVLILSFPLFPATATQTNTVVIGISVASSEVDMLEDDSLVGFNIDLVDAIAADAGLTVEWVNIDTLDADGLTELFANGEVDGVVRSMTGAHKPSNEEVGYVMTDPYLLIDYHMYIVKDAAVDLQGDSTIWGEVGNVENTEDNIFYASVADTFAGLLGEEVDVIVANALAVQWLFAEDDAVANAVEEVGDLHLDALYRIAVSDDMPELVETFNASLANVVADGRYDDIFGNWVGTAAPTDYFEMLNFIAEARSIERDLLDLSLDVLIKSSEEMEESLTRYDSEVAPAIDALTPPDGASGVYDTLGSYGANVRNAIETWSGGNANAVFPALNNANRSRFSYNELLVELVNIP